jgi:hypothetical protein
VEHAASDRGVPDDLINDRPDIANATGYRSGFQIRF